jgi:hypothetical protein
MNSFQKGLLNTSIVREISELIDIQWKVQKDYLHNFSVCILNKVNNSKILAIIISTKNNITEPFS